MSATMATITSKETETLPVGRIIRTILATKSLGQFHANWSSLAIYLETPSDRVKRIRDERLVNKMTLTDALYEIIDEWHARCGSAATLDKLIRGFEDLDLNSVGEALRLEFNLPCKDSESPSLSWDDIGSSFQKKVDSSLGTFYPSINFDLETKSKLISEELVDLMTGKKPSPIKNIIPDTLKYYVPRTLITRDRLTEKIFEHSSDTFLFTGIEISVLSRFVNSNTSSYQRTDTTTSQLNNRNLEVKYMILDMPNHFTKFKSTSDSSVHHIKYEEDMFYWVKSSGSLDSLRRFIDKSQIHLSESEFLKRICSSSVTESNLPVCISDSPGMGKSEILKRVASNIPRMQADRAIIFQEFPNFISVVNRLKEANNDLHVCIQKALEELTRCSELGKSILQSKLNSETVAIELLLDGYDELSAALVKTANAILQEIHSSSKSIRLWVTTRPHLLRNLENMFTVLGYTIQSFNPEDQVAFLTSYWLREQVLPFARLTEYATNCLKQIKSTLSVKEEDIAGIPLQCLMIGEVYEEEATDYSQSDVAFSGIKILVTSITDLYKLTIVRKLLKYHNLSTYGKQKLSIKELINMHIQLSLKLIFKDALEKLKSKFTEIERDDILNVGILQSKESELKFIHRTFAEYFVSWYFVNIMLHGKYFQSGLGDENQGNIADLRTLEVLKCKQARNTNEFQYPVICFFINSLLSGAEVKINTSHTFVKLFDGGQEIKQLARACINSDFINIFNLFDRYNAFAKFEKDIFDEDLALKAIKKASVDFIKITTARFERVHQFDVNFQTKALRAAAERGEFLPLGFLLDEKKLRTLIEDEGNWKGKQLLHCCVEITKECSEEIIRQKIQVIQFLVKINRLQLEEKDNKRCTPLVSPNVHVRLLIKLIESGSNVLARNEKYETILHFFKYYTPEEYCSLVTSIKKEDMNKLANIRRYAEASPLLQLIETMDPEEKTLDVFKAAKADFNIRDIRLFSLLASAVINGRSVTTIRKLIQCGSDIAWRGKDNCNLLHVASRYCNLHAIPVLVENNVDINALSDNHDSPLHTGAQHTEWAGCLKIIKAVIECGGNATAQNKEGNTFLHKLLCSHENITAAQFHDVVQLLIQLNHLNVLQVDNKLGISSLVLALATADVDEKTLSLLHRHNVNILKSTTGRMKDYAFDYRWISFASDILKILGNADVTLLHAASLHGNYRVIPFLLKIGLKVNGRDSSSSMPLHYVYCCRYDSTSGSKNLLNTIKILIENGADVYATVNDGDTFLHTLLRDHLGTVSDHFHELTEYLVTKNHGKLFNIHGKNGVTPLHLAVKIENVKVETISCMSGVKFDSVDNDGYSVLMYAILAKKSRDFLENLISCGANAKQTNKKDQNLLHFAAQYGNIEVVEFIISLGIDVNGTDTNEDTPLHLLCGDYWGWRDIPVKIIKLLIKNGASVTKLNKNNVSPFSLAKPVFRKNTELLYFLSNTFAEEINNQDENGNAQLHTSVSNNNFVHVNELVEMGAKVNLQNKRLETPLHIASSINDKSDAMKMIKLLINRKADPFLKDENDYTFLHTLLSADSNLTPGQFHNLAEYLIIKGHLRLLETPGRNNGTTPIHLALFNFDVEGRTLALLSSHVDWNLSDNHGKTPLSFITYRNGNPSLLSQVVNMGADCRHLDRFGNTFLHFAAECGNIEALEYFISLGLPVNVTNASGNTPLHVALLLGRENVPEIIRILAKAGGDANLSNNVGQTPFLILAQKIDTTK